MAWKLEHDGRTLLTLEEAVWLAVICLVLALIVNAAYERLTPKPLPGIPYNEISAQRFAGDIPDMRAAPSRRQWLMTRPQEHGSPLSQVLVPLFAPFVVLTDYREVWDILTRRTREFDRGAKMGSIIGYMAPSFQITLRSSDTRFKAHRELVKDLMTPGFLSQIAAPRIYENTTALVDLWNARHEKFNGLPFAAKSDLFRVTVDNICSVAFGMEESRRLLKRERSNLENLPSPSDEERLISFPTAQADPETEALLEMAELADRSLKSVFPWVTHTLAMFEYRHALCWWRRKKMIDDRTTQSLKKLAEGGEAVKETALDQVLWREMRAAEKEKRKPNFYSSAIRDEMLGFLLAGEDTSAAALAWWVKYMTNNQRVQKRLRDSLSKVYQDALNDGRSPSVEEITSTSVPYLEAVVEELLRVSTALPFVERTTTCDTQILGHPLPKGTVVYLALTGPSLTEPAIPVAEDLRYTSKLGNTSSNTPSAWSESSRGGFQPERWLKKNRFGEEVFDITSGPNMAFSVGPRACFGKKLAYLQIKTVVTLITWNFKLEKFEGAESMSSEEAFTTTPAQCYVKLEKIE